MWDDEAQPDTQPKTYEQMRRERVLREITSWSDETGSYEVRYSEYRRALDAITKAATEFAVAQNAPLDGYGNDSFEDILGEAVDVLIDLKFAVGADQGEDKLRLWSHRIQPLYDLTKNKSPDLNRPQIEVTVGRYLRLPYRSPEIDRLFVDLLVALELYAYGNETINAPSIPGVTSASPLKRRPILEWFVNLIVSVALWIGVAFALWGLSLIHLFPESWLGGANVVLGLLVLLSVAWSTVWLPRTWWVVRMAKKKIMGLLEQMAGVYAELRSDGPISARHIEERARVAANAGVVWPAPLFVLLDDINQRGGKF